MENETKKNSSDSSKILFSVHGDKTPAVIICGGREGMENLKQSISRLKSERDERSMSAVAEIIRQVKVHDISLGGDEAILAIVV